jgi:dienelactone hydrolase
MAAMRTLPLLLLLASCAAPASAPPAAVRGVAVEYKHGDVVLEGWLAWDASIPGRRPGVLVSHEWRGHNDYARRRAEQLASLGYVAFALDMYGKGVMAKDHVEAGQRAGVFKKDRALMRGRARAGYDVLATHELCDASRIVALGYCFGGTTSLELARSGAPLAGAASFHGDLSTPDPADAKNIRGKVAAFHGAEDPFYKDDHVAAFMNEMRAAKADWRAVFFGGAVHSFTVPDAGNDPSKGSAYDAKADARSWAMLEDFLRECLGR